MQTGRYRSNTILSDLEWKNEVRLCLSERQQSLRGNITPLHDRPTLGGTGGIHTHFHLPLYFWKVIHWSLSSSSKQECGRKQLKYFSQWFMSQRFKKTPYLLPYYWGLKEDWLTLPFSALSGWVFSLLTSLSWYLMITSQLIEILCCA